MRKLLPIFIILIVVAGLVWWWADRGGQDATAQASLLPLLSEEDAGAFARATEPGAISFPEDLGPHPDYQTEWWYYTGNLQTADGRRFGYQLTFFRRAIGDPRLEIGDRRSEINLQLPISNLRSDWRTDQIYLAHFTVSDIDGEGFYPAERFSRGAAGLAGARAEPYHVWLENWYARQVEPGVVRLFAESEQATLDLTLTETLPPILHGDEGLSPKGPEPGNASYYYSIVRQETEGMVTVGGQQFQVTGLSWKDHEYSTSALSPGAVGWDWFSLQLDNGAALMFFQIRREDGALQPESSGTFVLPDGSTRHIPLSEWNVEVTGTWTSPHSGATYPAAWRISIPALELELEGRALLADQELNVSTTYWEGAVQFSGAWQGEPVSATGYIELTGYAETMEGRI
ncbi:MAG TPA: lipocalin-like domain-containing protein [Candidatus Sulfomarinibacteraceae bacterium]|nr:lipocalin-like domain-containing protein [Candidatus Sulfomarinibacteraceae bacterium]